MGWVFQPSLHLVDQSRSGTTLLCSYVSRTPRGTDEGKTKIAKNIFKTILSHHEQLYLTLVGLSFNVHLPLVQ